VTNDATFVGRWIANPRSLIAYSLLVGAVAGTSIWARYLVAGASFRFWFLFSAVAYYTFAGYAGVKLLKRAPSGDLWALAALIPQVVHLQTGGMVFRIVCGLHLTLTFGGWDINFSLGAGTNVEVGVLEAALSTRVGVNLVPLLLISYLWHQLEEPPNKRLKLTARVD
jgi:hypothetical protein